MSLTLKLSAHLTAPHLERELAAVDRQLDASSSPTGLLVDARAMTSYDADARDLFIRWNSANRARIRKVAIVTQKVLWRMVIATMALTSRQAIQAFVDVDHATRWLG